MYEEDRRREMSDGVVVVVVANGVDRLLICQRFEIAWAPGAVLLVGPVGLILSGLWQGLRAGMRQAGWRHRGRRHVIPLRANGGSKHCWMQGVDGEGLRTNLPNL